MRLSPWSLPKAVAAWCCALERLRGPGLTAGPGRPCPAMFEGQAPTESQAGLGLEPERAKTARATVRQEGMGHGVAA